MELVKGSKKINVLSNGGFPVFRPVDSSRNESSANTDYSEEVRASPVKSDLHCAVFTLHVWTLRTNQSTNIKPSSHP